MLLAIEAETLSWHLAVAISGANLRPGPERVNGKAGEMQACVGGRAGAQLGGPTTYRTTLMSSHSLDPNLPADHAPIVSSELREQFLAIKTSLDDIRARLIAVTPLGLTVSNPPTQAQVQALANKLDQLITALNG